MIDGRVMSEGIDISNMSPETKGTYCLKVKVIATFVSPTLTDDIDVIEALETFNPVVIVMSVFD